MMYEKRNNQRKEAQLLAIVTPFCAQYLNDECLALCEKVIKKLGQKPKAPFMRGQPEIWSAAVVYAIARVNFLFDKSNKPYIRADMIHEFFAVKKSSVTAKAKQIETLLNLSSFDAEFTTAEIQQENSFTQIDSLDAAKVKEIFMQQLMANVSDPVSVLSRSAMQTDDYDKRQKLFKQAVDLFEQKKGAEFFTKNQGNFWLISETRPYMDALYGYGRCLWENGKPAEAIAVFARMLQLNPNDNQGIRYTLLNWQIIVGNFSEAEKIIAEFQEESGAMLFSQLLLESCKMTDPDKVLALADAAKKDNPHFDSYVCGKWGLPETPPFGYSPGTKDEVVYYMLDQYGGEAWDRVFDMLEKAQAKKKKLPTPLFPVKH